MNYLHHFTGLFVGVVGFFVDESALVIGTRTMASLAVNFLGSGSEQ